MVRTSDYEKILKNLALNGEYADIFIESFCKRMIVFEDGRLDTLSFQDDAGVGLRLIRDGKTFYGFSNSAEVGDIEKIASELVSYSKNNNGRSIDFTRSSPVRTFEKPSEFVPLKDKIKLVETLSKVSFDNEKVVQVQAFYGEVYKEVRVLNSLGSDKTKDLSYLTIYSNVTAKKGDELQTGYEAFGGVFGVEELANIDVENIGKEALRKALNNLEADYAPAGRMPVVLGSKSGGTMVHEAVGHGLEADLAEEGMSVYAGKIGEKVANSLITVIDDGTLTGKRGYIPFDDEGTDGARNVLIENGILKAYMRDRLYSIKNGEAPTGNGRRESYRFKPVVRMTNTFIQPGNTPPEDIISSVNDGIYVADMGGGQVNTVNGDFVFEVTEGYLIKNGKIDKPIKNATLMGNGPEVMQSIDMVGNDLGFGVGTCGKAGQGVPVSDAQPTLRIPLITVGGK